MYQNLPQNYYNPYGNLYQQQQPPYMQRPAPTPMEAPQLQTAPTASNYLKGWPVTSIEQARAARIDLDGSPFLFTDYGHNKIYMKQINMDGNAALHTFTLVDEVQNTQPDFVTREQLQRTLMDFKNSLFQPQMPQQLTSAPTDKIIPQHVQQQPVKPSIDF